MAKLFDGRGQGERIVIGRGSCVARGYVLVTANYSPSILEPT